MNMINKLVSLHDDMRQWRRHLHRFPETAYEETATADFIAGKLKSFNLEIHRGWAKTGIVAVLSAGSGDKKIALRADMDALFIEERNDFAHKSQHSGKMHACGHDGHIAMLLGAAKYLAERPNFSGTVYFIFQPAEEGRAGAKQMLDDGLFEKLPCDSVFGMHNFPDIPAGHFAVKTGAMMASFDCFEIVVNGTATHAALPHLGNDPLVAAAHLINALQTIVSRQTDPLDAAVVSITQIHGGNTWNAIPETAILRGTLRCFKEELRQTIMERLIRVSDGVCKAFGVRGEVRFNPENPGYPVTLNSPEETAIAAYVAAQIAGAEHVNLAPAPCMGSEDFAFMLQQKPGCYILIGNGPSAGSCLLHNPHYDFNDEILPIGAAYWVKLVKTLLPLNPS